MHDGVVDLPGVFNEPALPFDRLDAKLAWKIDPAPAAGGLPSVTVKVSDARFANADAQGELSATWHTGAGVGLARGGRYPGDLELDGKIVDGRAVRTVRYLPLGLPDSVRDYVGRSVRGGTITSATFRVRGDLWDFPFHNARSSRDGEFHIAAKLDDVTFAYLPGGAPEGGTASAAARADGIPVEAAPASWPPLTGVSGELVVDRTALEIREGRARLSGVEWLHVHGIIPALGDHARLDLDGVAHGPLSDMLRYVNATPIGRWIGRSLATTTSSGVADLKLALAIPLDDAKEPRVKGTLSLGGNDVRMTPDTPLLAGARARIEFTQNAFTVAAASARVLGGDLAFEGGSQGRDMQRFVGQGTIAAEALRRAPELGTLARMAALLSGQTSYRATLAFVGGHPQIGFTSNLVGMGIDLPQPLRKAAATPLALRVQTVLEEFAPVAGGGPSHESLQVEVGDVLQARFVRELTADSSRVVRGAIRLGEPGAASAEALNVPTSGVTANIAMRRLDVDEWEAVATRLLGEPGASASRSGPPLVFDASGGVGYVPDTVAVRVGELVTGTRRLTNLTAGLSQVDGLWRANVDARELAGYVEYRPARRGAPSAAGAGRVFARLSRLSLPKGEEERVESLLDEQPASVPSLDVVVEDFELRGKRLGRLEIEATNRQGGRDSA